MGSRLDRIGDWDVLAEQAQYHVKELAGLCEVSLRQLERYTKETFKQTPERWINELRLRKAQEFLLQGRSVKETALSLGFKQVPHFCREFKRYTGTTPSAYWTQCPEERTAATVAARQGA